MCKYKMCMGVLTKQDFVKATVHVYVEPRGDSNIKKVGMLVENFEIDP